MIGHRHRCCHPASGLLSFHVHHPLDLVLLVELAAAVSLIVVAHVTSRVERSYLYPVDKPLERLLEKPKIDFHLEPFDSCYMIEYNFLLPLSTNEHLHDINYHPSMCHF